ncbi:hypothetical protein DIURU_001930 [Diutina rugosa]|uniref:ER membrane protein complex subunit 6 n=1 Tax=Diutina rugosa TaxID=5481 RepID=A0A642USA6_DIURU|nr:uncharacterized protein DIURU_001930 [Diutina rugosa]KAA8904349.1 hypothetical protein DIURU_001930 [Diutina rugosa]
MSSSTYPTSVAVNVAKFNKVNDLAGLVNGAACGILQLEGLNGFLYYAVSYTLVNTLFVIISCQGTPKRFFQGFSVFANGFIGNIAGFIMMWCLTGALVKA